ncbi:MAG: hypothetical protein ACYTFX_03670 [Planctomycetota bacterium]
MTPANSVESRFELLFSLNSVEKHDDAYNPLCDLNDPAPDNIINEADLSVFADQWLITPCP